MDAPFAAVALPLFLGLLARWSSRVRTSGRWEVGVDASAELLESLVGSVSGKCHVALVAKPVFAAPFACSGSPSVVLEIRSGVVSNLGVLWALAIESRLVYGAHHKLDDASGEVGLASFLRQLADNQKGAGWFLAQLLWCVAGHLECSCCGDSPSGSTLERVRWWSAPQCALRTDIDDALLDTKTRDSRLWAHWQGLQRALRGQRVVSISPDWSRVGRKSVGNIACCLPDNRAFWLPPMVTLGQTRALDFGGVRRETTFFFLQVCFKNAFCGFTKSGLRGARIAQFARHVAKHVRHRGH